MNRFRTWLSQLICPHRERETLSWRIGSRSPFVQAKSHRAHCLTCGKEVRP